MTNSAQYEKRKTTFLFSSFDFWLNRREVEQTTMSNKTDVKASASKKSKQTGSASYQNSAFDVEPVNGASPMGSNIFIVKPEGEHHNRVHPEPHRHEPVTRSNIGRTIFRAIRCESRKTTTWRFSFSFQHFGPRVKRKKIFEKIKIYTWKRRFENWFFIWFSSLFFASVSWEEKFIRFVLLNISSLVTFGMTSTKTYYFTTVLRTIFTEQKVDGPGDQPAFDDIATFDDFWNVRLFFSSFSFTFFSFVLR